MAAGMVYLYYRDGDLVDGRQYKTVSQRHEIIKEWKTRYAAAYHNTFLQIAPVCNCDKVSTNGENRRQPYYYNKFYNPQK